MKIFKIVILFLIVAGAILFIFNLSSIGDKLDGRDIPNEDKVDITAKCEDIRTAWDNENGWNKVLFLAQKQVIEQENKLKMYSPAGYQTVLTCLYESAANTVYRAYNNALDASPFQHDNVLKCYNGVEEVSKMDGLSESTRNRIEALIKTHDLYNRIYRFVNNPHRLSSKFDEQKGWKTFDGQCSDIVSIARKYKENPYFIRLKGIPGFAEGLDESRLKIKLNGQKESFFIDLSGQIINAFKNKDRTQENYISLSTFSDEYFTQYDQAFGKNNPDYGARKLARFRSDFENECKTSADVIPFAS